MSRLHAFLVAAGLAVGAVGCAHCDTCDDFPSPCNGPNCGGGPNGVYGGPAPVAYSGPSTSVAMPGEGAPDLAPTAPGTPGTPAVNPSSEMKPSTIAKPPADAPPPAEASPPKPTEPSL